MGRSKFKFNKNTGRFLYIWEVGFYDVPLKEFNNPDGNINTPSMAIGSCNSF